MWIMLNDSFLSIVENETDPTRETLMVRARIPGDIEAAFPSATIIELESHQRDYRYRAIVSRAEAALTIGQRITDIDYPDFKSSIKDHERHNVMLSLWVKLKAWQDRVERPQPALPIDDGFSSEASQLGLYEPPRSWWKPTPFLAQGPVPNDPRKLALKSSFHRRPMETTRSGLAVFITLTCGHELARRHRPSGREWRRGILCTLCKADSEVKV